MDKDRYMAAINLLVYNELPQNFLPGPKNSNKRNNFSRFIRGKFSYKIDENQQFVLMREDVESCRAVLYGNQEDFLKIIEDTHEDYNHAGKVKLYDIVSSWYYIQNCRNLCGKIVNKCVLSKKK